jgi:gliding motility-associated lipoprotein GldD
MRFPLKQLPIGVFVCLLFILLTVSSCHRNEMPKPYAYPRLTYPVSTYLTFSAPDYDCRFEYPAQFVPTRKKGGGVGNQWIDFRFDRYGITLYTSYMKSTSRALVKEQVHQHEALLEKKIPPYASVRKRTIQSKKEPVSLFLYEVDGNSATPLEFLITDNEYRIFSGKVLFDEIPDRDSLADIMNGLSKDMLHLMTSFQFTNRP